MRGEIKQVLQGLSKPTVIVTHDQLEALTMADRIAVMRDGRIEQVDTPHNVFSKPANLFVAGFIGTPQMNLLPTTYTGKESNGMGCFKLDQDQSISVALNDSFTGIQEGSQVTLGIRPRNLKLVSEARSDSISLPIDLIEPMGAETLAHLKEGERDLRIVTDWKIPLTENEVVHAQLLPGTVHVFADSEQRVTTL